MTFFQKLTIAQRIAAGFALTMMLTAVLAWISVSKVNGIDAALTTVNDVNSVKQRHAINFRGSVHDRAIALRDVVLLDAAVPRADAERNIGKLEAKYAAAAGPLDAMMSNDPNASPDERAILADIKASEAETMPLVRSVVADRTAGRIDQAKSVLLLRAAPAFTGWLANINRFIDLQESRNQEVVSATRAETQSFQFFLLQICAVALAVSVGIAAWCLRSVRPLRFLATRMNEMAAGDFTKDIAGADRDDEVGRMAKAVQVFRDNGIAKLTADSAKAQADAEQKMVVDTVSSHLSDLSTGDLTSTITTDFPREYAVLKTNFNEAVGKLHELIGTVAESATAIRTGSSEIAQASEDLARRTESNAASLEETAASVTQMDGRLRASAAAATRTVERADQAIATVGGGRAMADDAVQAMGRVADSAKGIDDVIEGLDKIAFQTRVLAMNAAVEAGRAGDAGRGFAVVADLVSALAMRAEEEAKRARDQLTVTQTDIVTAVDAVTKVDGALQAIFGDVGQVHELLATMATDNQAQSAAITQISAAIGTMDQATQQNAAMVEETSAAARNLSGEVGALSEQANRFRVRHDGDCRRPAAAKADFAKPAAYTSPIRPLPAAAIPAMVRMEDDRTAF